MSAAKKQAAAADTKSAPAAITLIEAITQALAYEMRNDDSVLVLGEDVGVNGGVFRATAGLSQTFGTERVLRSEEHTSELQSLMRISYAVFCLKKKTKTPQ